MTKPTPTGVDRGKLMHRARHGDPEQREQARDQLKAMKRDVPNASHFSHGSLPDNVPTDAA